MFKIHLSQELQKNLGIYQKFYFNFYHNNDKKIYSDIHKNEIKFMKDKTKDIYNQKLNKTNHKLDNLVSINKKEENIQMNKDIFIKEEPKENNGDDEKKINRRRSIRRNLQKRINVKYCRLN